MGASIERKDRWVREQYGSANRHSLQEESVIYYRELKKTLRQALKRGRRRPGSEARWAAWGQSNVTRRVDIAA